MSALFTWNDAFITGLPSVDDQHQKLVGLINALSLHCMSGQELDALAYAETRDTLLGYAKEHFTEEELQMKQCGIDPRHIDQHHIAHQSFLSEAHLLGDESDGMTAQRVRFLFDYLVNWLAYHILGIDQSMARQALAIKAGTPAAQAYDNEALHTLSGTEPLLNALRGLLQMLSMRNAELRSLNHELEQRVTQRTADLEYANRQLQMLSSQDDLTGLPNRRFAVAALNELWAEARRDGTALSVLMLDADHFKPVNDQFGHAVGDELLRHLALRLRNAVRTSDIVCRLGGDEFLVICPRSSTHGAATAAQKILDLQTPFHSDGALCWDGALSIGVAQLQPDMQMAEDLLKAADKALYKAKQQGGRQLARASA